LPAATETPGRGSRSKGDRYRTDPGDVIEGISLPAATETPGRGRRSKGDRYRTDPGDVKDVIGLPAATGTPGRGRRSKGEGAGVGLRSPRAGQAQQGSGLQIFKRREARAKANVQNIVAQDLLNARQGARPKAKAKAGEASSSLGGKCGDGFGQAQAGKGSSGRGRGGSGRDNGVCMGGKF
jgi:hypothetical protein